MAVCCRLQLLKLFLKPPPRLGVTAVAATAAQLRPLTKFAPRVLVRTPWPSLSNSTTRTLIRRRLSSAPPKNKPPPAGGQEDAGAPEPKLSLFQKFKVMYRDYWYVLVPVHVVTSIGWIGGFYYLAQSGVDIGYYLKKMGFSEKLVSKANSGAGYLAIAYALYKLATPARYAVTLGGTTWAINRLRNLGYITPAREIIQKNRAKLQEYARGTKTGGGGGGKN